MHNIKIYNHVNFFYSFRYNVRVSGEWLLFKVLMDKSSEWIHAVFNLFGPGDEQRIRIYHDGILQIGDYIFGLPASSFHNLGDGKIVIGRRFTDFSAVYASVEVDEVLFFNQSLSEAQIVGLGNTKLYP